MKNIFALYLNIHRLRMYSQLFSNATSSNNESASQKRNFLIRFVPFMSSLFITSRWALHHIIPEGMKNMQKHIIVFLHRQVHHDAFIFGCWFSWLCYILSVRFELNVERNNSNIKRKKCVFQNYNFANGQKQLNFDTNICTKELTSKYI